MAFLSPWFLLGGLLAAVPVMLHFFKRQPAALVRFSAVRLLTSAPVEHARRRRLRDLVLLALRVASVLLLALAFSRPFFASATAASAVTVVVLDTSLSMSAPGRMERARDLAAQAVNRVPRGERVAVVTFDSAARVASGPSADRAQTLAAVREASPGAAATSYRAALTAAVPLVGGRGGAIVVVTDLQRSGWAGDRPEVPASTRVDVLDVGAPVENLALVDLRVAGDRVVASVRNTGTTRRTARVHLSAGRAAGEAPRQAGDAETSIEPNEVGDVLFATPDARWASAAVEDQGGVGGDNTRYIVLGAASAPTVLVLTSTGGLNRDAFYVEQALASGSGRDAYAAEGASGGDLQSWDQRRVDAQAAVLLLSTRGLERRGRQLLAEYIRTGGGLAIAAGPDVDGDVIADLFGGSRIGIVKPDTRSRAADRVLSPLDVRHPLFRAFDGQSSLALVRFRSVATLRAEGCQALATFTTGEPALVDCESGGGRVIIFASDLDHRWNDFPLHATFVPFLHETVRYLSGSHVSPSYLVGAQPPGVPPAPGVAMTAVGEGAAPRMIAVNVDPAEIDPARMTVAEWSSTLARVADGPDAGRTLERRDREESQHLWQYALALMLTTLVAESVIGREAVSR